MRRPIKYPLQVSSVRGGGYIYIVDANGESVVRLPYSPQLDQQDRRDADRLVRYANVGALIHQLIDEEAKR